MAQVEFDGIVREPRLRWTGVEEGQWIYWKKNAEDGVFRQEEKMKTAEEVYGCSEGGHTEGGVTENAGMEMEKEADELLCRPLKGVTGRRRLNDLSCLLS